MKITFEGAARTVTGSQHLIQVNGYNLLLDCGFFQGHRQESYERNLNFPFDPAKIDAVILSHAHIDHSGNLPNLVKHGFHGTIFTTLVTACLAEIMLLDSGHIQEADVAFINKFRQEKGEPAKEPIYTRQDASLVPQHFKSIDYNQPFEPVPGVTVRLVEAGHILGSAAIVLDVEENRRVRQLWFSGDIGRPRLPLVRDPKFPVDTDFLVMECTYGNTSHPDPETAFNQLRQVVLRTLNRHGKVIIPAFAVGRTQELVYELNRLMVSGDIPRVPVFVDSPLAVQATDIFSEHTDFFDEETQAFMRSARGRSALGFGLLTYTRSAEESKALNERKDPMIIISASGMAENGRILHHLRHNIGDARNTILIVGWQAPNTLGRRLVEGERQVRIFGEFYERRAEVVTIAGYSAHAGQEFLLEYALAAKERVGQIFLVHGEAEPAEALRQKVMAAGFEKITYPELHQTVEI